MRLSGKSHPASHRFIEDVRNRLRHPLLDVTRIELEAVQLPTKQLPEVVGSVRLRLRIQVKNVGRLMAKNACLHVEFSGATVRFDNFDNHTIRPRGIGTPFWEVMDPVYPGMGIEFWIEAIVVAELLPARPTAPFRGPWAFREDTSLVGLDDVRLLWRLFADNAPVKEATATLEALGFTRAAQRAIDTHPRAREIQKYYGL